MKHNFLDIKDISAYDLKHILQLGANVKKNPELYYESLKHKKMILCFEKHSTRTRISFQFAIEECGGHCCVVNSGDSQLSRGEPIEDTAKVFDKYADIVVLRTFGHDRLLKMAENCQNAVVVNALTDKSHPCQIMADIMTIIENFGEIENKKICWIGDANNMLQSWIEASENLNFQLNICCPESIKDKCLEMIGGCKNCHFIPDKFDASKECDVITTDTWVSMGEDKSKIKMFDGFIVDSEVMNNANKNAIFLHCLPAYRGYEVSADVIDDTKYSKIVFEEAGNRLHAQKAIILWCLGIE